jgi:hypothetical protein
MTLSLEMNMIIGAFVVKIAGAAWKRLNGLAWKSGRGLRPWQMYVWVFWEPGRADVSFTKCAGWDNRLNKIQVLQSKVPLPATSHIENTKTGETVEGIANRQKEGARRMFGSLSTSIVPFESRVTDPREPVSRKGRYRVMDSLLRNTSYTRR